MTPNEITEAIDEIRTMISTEAIDELRTMISNLSDRIRVLEHKNR